MQALKNELRKLGAEVEIINDDSLKTLPTCSFQLPTSSFSTYTDHRMAMSFAPLALVFGKIGIKDPEVVKKSYPGFWEDMRSVGFVIEELEK